VVPRQLPAAARHFTGRQAELDKLVAFTQVEQGVAGTVVISAIDGMAGIGKTALSVHAAHRLADRFPGGQLFVDLHGYTKGYPPRDAGWALDWFLRSLGVPAQQIPEDLDEKAALYRQHLAGSRTLILLDNALDEAQVRPLLPGHADCLVLVTSRRRLKALDDASTLSLDPLPPPDAIALLTAVAGPARAPAVAELCGCLPLALRIAGALLRHRPAWNLGRLAAQLRDRQRRVDVLADGDRDLAAVFDLSYTSLGQRHQLLFRCLGLVPGPDVDAYAAAALMDVDPDTVSTLLGDLLDHNLLIEHAPGRYQLHDLLRAHAGIVAEHDDAQHRRAGLDRLLHYYAHTAQAASVLISQYPRPQPEGRAPAYAPTFGGPDDARAWLRAELPNLDAAFVHARAHQLHRQTAALAAGLAEILRDNGSWSHGFHIQHIAAENAERLGRTADHATALTELGTLRYLTGDYPSAADDLARALRMFSALNDRHGRANALTHLGNVRRLIGDYPGAVDALTQALEIYRALDNRRGQANALNYLGYAWSLTGDFPGAVDALTQALGVFRSLGDRHGQANVLNYLGTVRCMTGDYPEALTAHSQALDMFRALGHLHGQANALNYLGTVRCAIGDYPGATDAHIQALEMFTTLGHLHGQANALNYMGNARRLTGDYPEALTAHSQALEMFRALGSRNSEAFALNGYAATLAATGEHTQALACYQRALAMNRELNKPDDEAIALEGIAEHHLTAGDPHEGVTQLRRALDIYQRLGMNAHTQRVQARLSAIVVP
jgi:tetratricopeptide (TPR) repeat protein